MIATSTPRFIRATALAAIGIISLAACSSTSTTKASSASSASSASVTTVPASSAATTAAADPATTAGGSATVAAPTTAAAVATTAGKVAASGPVLPVKENPIKNAATAKALKVDSVHLEDNVDAAGKAVNDHLEVALSNSGTTPLSGIEFYYTFTDPTTKVTESYYAKLPDDFTIPAGGKRVAHFDNTGKPDHFPVNKFSLYYSSKNALEGSVVVSATGAATQTAPLKKDAGGAEAAD
jgi:hypothetical protein